MSKVKSVEVLVGAQDICLVSLKKGKSIPIEVKLANHKERDVFCLIARKHLTSAEASEQSPEINTLPDSKQKQLDDECTAHLAELSSQLAQAQHAHSE